MSSGNVRFDHFLTYVDSPSIDRYLDKYRAMGFLVGDRTLRFDPGLRNGYVLFGSQYLEFLWVEDEKIFSEGAPDEAVVRESHRPFGVGLVSDDIQATHNDWLALGYQLPNVFSKGEPGTGDVSPLWTFQEIPEALLPGAFCFACMYHLPKVPSIGEIAPNSTYAVAGATFVSSEAEGHALAWRDLLSPGSSVDCSDNAFQFALGPHVARWLDPVQYKLRFGRSFQPAQHQFAELALVEILATDLACVRSSLVGAGREFIPVEPRPGEEPGLFLPPDSQDGFSFVVTEQPIEN